MRSDPKGGSVDKDENTKAWYVEIVEAATLKVEKRMGPYFKRSAEKIDAGATRNLDHDRFFTRVVKDSKRVIRKKK